MANQLELSEFNEFLLLFLDLTLRAIREIRGGLMNLGPPEFQVAREGAGSSPSRSIPNAASGRVLSDGAPIWPRRRCPAKSPKGEPVEG